MEHAKGIVKEVNEEKVVVIFSRTSACGKCEACGLLKETGDMYLEFDKDDAVEVGDFVNVNVAESFFLFSALMLYGIPLIVLLMGIGLGSIFFNEGYAQLIAAAFGVGLSGASYYVIKRFDGYFEKKKVKYMGYSKSKG